MTSPLADDVLFADDLALARSVATGDPEAAGTLVRRLLPRTRNLVRYLTRGDSEVEDLTHNALLEVLAATKGFAGRAPLEGWSDRIVVRSVKRRLQARSREETRRREHGVALRALRGDDAPTVGYAARRDLARALDELSLPQREALVMRHSLGMSVKEVAAETGVSFDTAKSRLRLGMNKLRELMGVGGEGAR